MFARRVVLFRHHTATVVQLRVERRALLLYDRLGTEAHIFLRPLRFIWLTLTIFHFLLYDLIKVTTVDYNYE